MRSAMRPSCEKADDGTRTRDLLITNQLLYQLSYIGIYRGKPSVFSHFRPPLYPLFVSLSQKGVQCAELVPPPWGSLCAF